MTGLTAAQIQSGFKTGKPTLLTAPTAETLTGRWICHLCPWPKWTRGTYQQWMDHWTTAHQKEEEK